MSPATVVGFNLTPVKSTALQRPETIDLRAEGAVGDRRFVFARSDGSREELLQQILAARTAVSLTLPRLDESRLDDDYPERVFDHPVSTRFFFIHLTAHLGYHLGQVNYHRRLMR